MKLVEQRIERIDDVLSLGSISNMHGIMSNEHHMYEPGAEMLRLRSQQTNGRVNLCTSAYNISEILIQQLPYAHRSSCTASGALTPCGGGPT